jgi:hypothetical protein
LVDHFLKGKPLVALFDSVLIPVVTAAGTDLRSGFLDGEQLGLVERGVGDILEAVSPESPIADESGVHVCCVPAKAHRDQLAGEMLVQLLWQMGYPALSAESGMSLGELLVWIRVRKADVICISGAAPTTLIHVRYLCSKLRMAFPAVRIIAGLWGREGGTSETVEIVRDSGADDVVFSLAEAIMSVKGGTPPAVGVLQGA